MSKYVTAEIVSQNVDQNFQLDLNPSGSFIKGGKDAGQKFIDNLKMFRHVANVGDTRSLAIHPATTTHSQLDEDQLIAAGSPPELFRLSIGIEDIEDILGDLGQALESTSWWETSRKIH